VLGVQFFAAAADLDHQITAEERYTIAMARQ
jgi:hypothetical protein